MATNTTTTPTLSQLQAKFGLQPATIRPVKPRMMVCSSGQTKCGKSDFCLSAPKPIVYLNFDRPLEPHQLRRWPGQILVKDITIPPAKSTMRKADASLHDKWKKLNQEVEDLWYAAVENPSVRTIVVDTCQEWWELYRLAEWGKSAIGQNAWGPVEAEFRAMIGEAYNREGLNLILTHKEGKRYVRTKKATGEQEATWDGTFERKGWSGAEFEMQVVVRHERVEGSFVMTCLRSGINPAADGIQLIDGDISFTSLGILNNPDSEESDWA